MSISSAYNTQERADFYEFIRGLDALKKTMTGDKTIVLSGNNKLLEKLIKGE